MSSKNPVLIIAGPTAVGKTAASILLAQELGAEIVCVDSMQIYRGMDIGTAKPTREQRALVPHNMIDIVDPDQPYSVGDYLKDAQAVIEKIRAAGKIPLVVGGTGLYIRALTRGLFEGPAADPQLREQFLEREASVGPGTLYKELVNLDPESALKIHPNDVRRTIRALEVYHLKDRKLSDFQKEHAFNDARFQYRLLFLVRARHELYPRIEARVDQMIQEGLEAEVKLLLDRGFGPELPSMKGLGYQHLMAYLQGNMPRTEAISLLKRDTKRYAKRQFTWFRREPAAQWIDVTGVSETAEVVDRIKKNIEIPNKLV